MRALLIDMDGTLVETESRWWQAEIKVMESHGSTWDIEDQNQAIGGPLQAVANSKKFPVKLSPSFLANSPEILYSFL